MIETVCAKFRKQNHPNNTLLLTWAAFLSHFRPILHDLKALIIIIHMNKKKYISYSRLRLSALATDIGLLDA